MPLNPKLILLPSTWPLPTYALSSQTAKEPSRPFSPCSTRAGWASSHGLCQGSVPATSCWLFSMPTAGQCDSPSVTDGRTYCHHSALVCADFLLQMRELSACQMLTASLLPGRSVPLGIDSHALIFLVESSV